jgi:mRNA-degrading endonuclease toxin of MazEF toxin-antitoxin module
MVPGDIFLGRFPFGGTSGAKIRPVLLLTGPVGSVPELVTAYISSVIPDPLLPSDLLLDPNLPDYASTNLKQSSVVRLHKIATVHGRDLLRQLGTLTGAPWATVQSRLRTLLNL